MVLEIRGNGSNCIPGPNWTAGGLLVLRVRLVADDGVINDQSSFPAETSQQCSAALRSTAYGELLEHEQPSRVLTLIA